MAITGFRRNVPRFEHARVFIDVEVLSCESAAFDEPPAKIVVRNSTDSVGEPTSIPRFDEQAVGFIDEEFA